MQIFMRFSGQLSPKAALGLSLLVVGGMAARPAQAQTATFNFDADTTGKTTTFSDVSGGDTATFSTTGAGVFSVEQTLFATLTGNILIDGLGASASSLSIPLDIAFSRPSRSFSLNFAQTALSPSPFVVNFFNNGVQVGGVTAFGALAASGFEEGTLSFSSGSLFNSVVITSPTVTNFAVDNIRVDAPVPEVSTMVSLGLLLALGAVILILSPAQVPTLPSKGRVGKLGPRHLF